VQELFLGALRPGARELVLVEDAELHREATLLLRKLIFCFWRLATTLALRVFFVLD
jgi:hypothetical protein